jgi:hypothetical protein
MWVDETYEKIKGRWTLMVSLSNHFPQALLAGARSTEVCGPPTHSCCALTVYNKRNNAAPAENRIDLGQA